MDYSMGQTRKGPGPTYSDKLPRNRLTDRSSPDRQTEELQLLKVKEISRDSNLDPPAPEPSASKYMDLLSRKSTKHTGAESILSKLLL